MTQNVYNYECSELTEELVINSERPYISNN